MSKRSCCEIVFPKGKDWRYCQGKTKFVDLIGRGWCSKHQPTEFLKKAWKMMKETGIAG